MVMVSNRSNGGGDLSGSAVTHAQVVQVDLCVVNTAVVMGETRGFESNQA